MVTKHAGIAAVLAAGALALAACDRPAPGPSEVAGPGPEVQVAPASGGNPGRPSERLALRLARAMRSPAFRAYVRAQLDGSPYREHKLPFRAFLALDGGHGRTALAHAAGDAEQAVDADLQASTPLEFYIPVPAHRAAWTGGEDLLVATALADSEAPVAFDVEGRRHVLDPQVPPATPVFALVPVETDFSAPTDRIQACLDPEVCGGGGGGGGGTGGGGDGTGGSTTSAGNLYMTAAHFGSTYESWLKGSPEFEVHILGQLGQSDSLADYQCAGEHAGGPYAYDQNDRDWTGSVLLFSQAQFDQYAASHPGRGVRVLFLEDDDTACQIKMDQNRFAALVGAADAFYRDMTSGRDTVLNLARQFHRARSGQSLLSALASWIKTNDDAIGTAVEDAVVGTFYPGFNWIVKGDNNVTNGWVRLEMR